jgi:hypothetical protein
LPRRPFRHGFAGSILIEPGSGTNHCARHAQRRGKLEEPCRALPSS